MDRPIPRTGRPLKTRCDADFLPLSRPSIGEREIQAVCEVLRSGWLTTGPRCAELEAAFRRATGAANAVAVTSATAGMHLLLHALGIGPGDEVITPSLTWVSTVNLITLRGATPVFADVDHDTLMVDAEAVAPLVTEKTRAIVPVHFAGASLDLEPLRRLAQERGVALIEDAAHAIGTRYREEPVGRRGTAIFSLHPIKNVTTGEGGVLVTDDEELAERCRRLRFHGLGADTYGRERAGRAPQAEVLEPGFKYNLPDLNAALGVAQMGRLDELLERRAWLARRYRRRLENLPGLLPLRVPEWTSRHAWHLFVVRLDPMVAAVSRAQFMQALKEAGIGTGIHFRAVHEHRYYREYGAPARVPLPATEWNSARVVSLPLFPEMTDADVDRVVGRIEEILS